MIWFPHLTPIVYSRETGDETLPPLAELVSDTPDECKDIILEYLSLNCIAASPGVIRDVIDPEQTIGHGDLYADDIYFWDDCFVGYVKKYNIPVPEKFRQHILENYEQRKKKHMLLRLMDSIEIANNPYLGYRFEISVNKSGKVWYKNNTDCIDGAFFMIDDERAEWIVREIPTQMFCYDIEQRGQPVIDGYRWTINFYSKKGKVYSTFGTNGEPDRRLYEFKSIIEFIERFVEKDLGSRYFDVEPPFKVY